MPSGIKKIYQLDTATLSDKIYCFFELLDRASEPKERRGEVNTDVLVALPYKSDIPWAIWNPSLTQRGIPQPKYATRLCVEIAVPVATFVMAVIYGTDKLRCNLLLNMMLVSVGVVVSSYGQIHFNVVGTVYQVTGIFAEALRLVLTQVLLQKKGLTLNPITSLYYIAPCRGRQYKKKLLHVLVSRITLSAARKTQPQPWYY
ncbi:hypothetical protein T459_05586 [Capsicum annuum]|uniref:Sugar phosphate transporter domain-containing protein n=1 Tax=Capsicum annuum TaxID=4072 RepID=A0A2G3A8G4_CAPAN|nr:hypothetical protein T459_05586 [Capsicum annuum]